MEDKIIETPFTAGEPVTLRAVANMTEQDRDFFTNKASKLYGIPYEEVTEEQRAGAKKLLMDYLYLRADSYPTNDCLITAKMLEPTDSENSLKNLYNQFIGDL